MKRKMQAQQIRRPWLALLAAACLVLAIPAGRLAAIRFAPAEDLLGYGGLAAAVSGIIIALLTGLVLGSLSLLRRESPRLLCVMILLAIAAALAAVLMCAWHDAQAAVPGGSLEHYGPPLPDGRTTPTRQGHCQRWGV